MTNGNAESPSVVRHEAELFFDVLQTTPPDAITACRGWTAHEIIAHLASGADALARQIEAHFDGVPVPEFGTWEQRERPYQAIDDKQLRRRLQAAEARMRAAFDALLRAHGAEGVVDGVGFGFPAVELVRHMRQEFAVHRWDLVGDDDAGTALLAQPELLGHCVRMLAEPLLAAGLTRDPTPRELLDVRIRVAAEPDLVVSVNNGQGALALSEPDDAPDIIETDAAARLLLLWGRIPAEPRRLRSTLSPQTLLRLQTILAGF